MANTTVYPFGVGGQIPGGIAIVNDPYTGGADKAGSAEMIKVLNGELNYLVEKDISSLSSVSSFIGTSGAGQDKWQSTTGYKCKFLAVNPGETYRIQANASRGTRVAILKTDSHTSGTDADYATGCSNVLIPSGEYYNVTVPSDGHYMYICIQSNSNDTTPQGVFVVVSKFASLDDQFLAINSQIIDTSSLVTLGWFINSNNKWEQASTTNNFAYALIPITPGEDYIVFGGTTNGIFAVLASATKSNGGTPVWATGYTGRIRVLAGEHYSFTAPEDAAYIYLNLRSSGNDYDPYAAIPKPIAQQVAEIGGGDNEVTKDRFDTAPEYYAWKKAMQMLQIKWTPLKGTIQRASGTTKFAAGTEQTGMVYSSVTEYDKRVGIDVSLHTFMTALHNPYSLMYTECVRYGYSQSAYGRQYYGASNSGPYYGGVCSTFTAYNLGLGVPYPTGDMDDLSDLGILDLVYDQSANGVKRGDILWKQGHNMFVQDVWRKNGVVTSVLVTEQVSPTAGIKGQYSADAFNALLASEHIIIYRYNEMFKNIKYEPSPYVAVGDETPQTVTYNDDICTFAGDKAAFAEGDLIYIHCLNLAYPQMEVYKDDVLIDTITLASDSRAALTSDELAYAVNLSNDNLTYGKYKCRLKDGDTYSDYTYFEVINAVVTVDEFDMAHYSSENANAVYWYWNQYHQTTGQKIWHTTPLPSGKTGTITLTGTRKSGYPLLKVMFQGDYGRIAAKYLES